MCRRMRLLESQVVLRMLGLLSLGLAAIFTATGCDYSSMVGLGGYPDCSLLDPNYCSDIIGSVIDYRQDVMDWSNNAWDEYILE